MKARFERISRLALEGFRTNAPRVVDWGIAGGREFGRVLARAARVTWAYGKTALQAVEHKMNASRSPKRSLSIRLGFAAAGVGTCALLCSFILGGSEISPEADRRSAEVALERAYKEAAASPACVDLRKRISRRDDLLRMQLGVARRPMRRGGYFDRIGNAAAYDSMSLQVLDSRQKLAKLKDEYQILLRKECMARLTEGERVLVDGHFAEEDGFFEFLVSIDEGLRGYIATKLQA